MRKDNSAVIVFNRHTEQRPTPEKEKKHNEIVPLGKVFSSANFFHSMRCTYKGKMLTKILAVLSNGWNWSEKDIADEVICQCKYFSLCFDTCNLFYFSKTEFSHQQKRQQKPLKNISVCNRTKQICSLTFANVRKRCFECSHCHSFEFEKCANLQSWQIKKKTKEIDREKCNYFAFFPLTNSSNATKENGRNRHWNTKQKENKNNFLFSFVVCQFVFPLSPTSTAHLPFVISFDHLQWMEEMKLKTFYRLCSVHLILRSEKRRRRRSTTKMELKNGKQRKFYF